MGTLARMSRAERFIDEFGSDFIRKYPVKAGDTLKVNKVSLGYDNNCQQVILLIDVEQLGEWLTDKCVLFDSDFDRFDSEQEMVDTVMERLSISKVMARKRLKKAKLID